MKKLNNKGFTLVELLAVLVILIAIMSIAIPSISSSLERSKVKQNEARIKNIESAAELYVTDNKNTIYTNLNNQISCYIALNTLTTNGYLSSDEIQDADGNDFTGRIIFTKPNEIQYTTSNTITLKC